MFVCDDCTIRISGANMDIINGIWLIQSKTENDRPIFKKGNQLMAWMKLRDYGRWYVTNENGRVGTMKNSIAFVDSFARSPNLVDKYVKWSERKHSGRGRFYENDKLKAVPVAGYCGRVQKLPMKEESDTGETSTDSARKSADYDPKEGCPVDVMYHTIKNEDYAIVHWVDPAQDDALHEILYPSENLSPGNKFKVGKTGVVYSVVDSRGRVVRTCDFTISVVDKDPPVIGCRKNIVTETDKNKENTVVNWDVPNAFDAVDGEVDVVQKSGLAPGSSFDVGNWRIRYTAKDSKGNEAKCNFYVRVRDNEPPTVHGCPKDYTIKVFEENGWAAHPKWAPPTGWDNVDKENVKVEQVAGLNAGEAFTLNPDTNETVVKMLYHISDKSGNSATCQFHVTLVKSEIEKKGVDFNEDLATEQPQAPDIPEPAGGAAKRADHFNKKRRGMESSKVQKMREKRDERRRKAKEKRRGGHRSKKHEERINRLKNKDKNDSPRQSLFESNKSWRWMIFKVFLIIAALAAVGALLFLYLSGELFQKKGKRLPTARASSKPGWFTSPKKKKYRLRGRSSETAKAHRG
eukprot:TRINITY_DN906_c0_g2_i2.p1 TRINITY_DN906_c0_g2~~TRINITY_DN906_c0_g2_i2.p1  ORF type:complete len:575 (+),score=136.00 TRINITY_DN906_c0_g2_i2:102-1826(+)